MSPMQQIFLGLGAVAKKTYVDDVFSANLYIGDGANSRTITTGIDLATDGGLTWLRDRQGNVGQMLFDTARGARKPLTTSSTAGQSSYPSGHSLTGWTTTGFTLGQNHNTENWNGYEYVNWNFKKTPKFFDIVTWTGNSVAGRTIPHNLESVPGAIIVKRYDSSGETWSVFHKDLDQVTGSSPSAKHFMVLEGTGGAVTYGPIWNNTNPTSSVFSVGTNGNVNVNGWQYVAYLFAHNNNDGDFGGQTGADGDIIKCGYYTGNGSSDGQSIDVGFEPQFIIQKTASQSSGGTWNTYDAMRGIVTGGNDEYLRANNNAAAGNADFIEVHPKGFKLIGNSTNNNSSGVKYIYICIRRSDGYVGKPVELGTDVFTAVYDTSGVPMFKTPNHDVDFTFQKDWNNASNDWNLSARLIQGKRLETNTDNAEETNSYQMGDYSRGWSSYTGGNGSRISFNFKRHAGMDVVCYKGDGSSNRQIPHNLSKIPEMMWVKSRTDNEGWKVYHSGLNDGVTPQNYYLILSDSSSENTGPSTWANTAPTATNFTVGNDQDVNISTDNFIAFLFSSIPGVSKIGRYTGSGGGNTQTITTGFAPRFLIVKCVTHASTPWYIFDTTRGWASGADKILKINEKDVEFSTDWSNPISTGFTVYGNGINISSGGQKFIYYAHA